MSNCRFDSYAVRGPILGELFAEPSPVPEDELDELDAIAMIWNLSSINQQYYFYSNGNVGDPTLLSK